MHVDGPAGSESSDYMQERPIEQGTDWARYDVVLDVPSNAVGVSFGVLLFGPGQVWLDDVALERVGNNVALTGRLGHVLAVGTLPSDVRAQLAPQARPDGRVPRRTGAAGQPELHRRHAKHAEAVIRETSTRHAVVGERNEIPRRGITQSGAGDVARSG
jgi:hypothetical protein